MVQPIIIDIHPDRIIMEHCHVPMQAVHLQKTNNPALFLHCAKSYSLVHYRYHADHFRR